MVTRLCLFCKHFEITDGDSGYSEYTPGYDMSIQCGKWDAEMYWKVNNYEAGGAAAFRENLRRAGSCADFSEVPGVTP